MGYTGTPAISQNFIDGRDRQFDVNTTQIREHRVNITAPAVIDGADSWKEGFILQLGLTNSTATVGTY
jgi:hypothetical protein